MLNYSVDFGVSVYPLEGKNASEADNNKVREIAKNLSGRLQDVL